MRLNRLLPLTLILPMAAGCGSVATNAYIGTGNPVANASNWQFQITDPGPGGVPPLSVFTGELSINGSNALGVFRATGRTTCVDPSYDIQFAGTVDSLGDLTLNSTNITGNVVTLTANVSSNALSGPTTGGSLTISGGGPCAFPNGLTALFGFRYSDLTGRYSADLLGQYAGTTRSTTVTTNLTQGSATSDGLFPESGTLTLGTGSCATTFAVNGTVTGSTVTANLSAADGTTATLQGAIASPSTSSISITLVVSSGCNTGVYTGTILASQVNVG